MNKLLVTSILLYLGTWHVQGFNLATLFEGLSTALFLGRKFGYLAKIEHILACEIVPQLIMVAWHLIFKKFSLAELLIVLLIRTIFFGLYMYDTYYLVYTDKIETRRKGSNE